MKTRAIINSSALAHNLAIVRSHAPGLPVIAMVKADAYGHGVAGLLPVLQHHADALGVARIVEAEAVRAAGYNGRLLLLCGVNDSSELHDALSLQLDILVHDTSQVSLFAACTARPERKTCFWLKMDTGMHRLGFSPQDFSAAFHALKNLAWCDQVIGMTHFASADETGNPKTSQQITCYQQYTHNLALDSHSLANSAGLLAWPASRTGWLRPGLMLYGVSPFPDNHHDLKPVMQLEAQVIGIKTVAAGETTGYNERWRAERESRLAFIAAGYADGYPITALNKSFVAVNGVRVPVIGRVSMDTIAVDCTNVATPMPGDWVELWGDTVRVTEVAIAAGSIPYQLLTAVSARVSRITM